MLFRSRNLCLFFATLALAGCTYDWGVGPAPSGLEDAGDTGLGDATAETNATCLAIIEQLDQRRPAATECLAMMVGTECTETDKDECGCNIGGVYPGPFDEYVALVEEFKQNDCSRSCSGCATAVTPKCTADQGSGPPHCQ